mmetsp:Transcript_144955/g.263600  ORF Transcript_144955/g.263600 Transcript_144955/m.263600 type:complete len:225 (-) Transcript_144955:1020-1694(-)
MSPLSLESRSSSKSGSRPALTLAICFSNVEIVLVRFVFLNFATASSFCTCLKRESCSLLSCVVSSSPSRTGSATAVPPADAADAAAPSLPAAPSAAAAAAAPEPSLTAPLAAPLAAAPSVAAAPPEAAPAASAEAAPAPPEATPLALSWPAAALAAASCCFFFLPFLPPDLGEPVGLGESDAFPAASSSGCNAPVSSLATCMPNFAKSRSASDTSLASSSLVCF